VLLDHSDARGLPAPFEREEARARGARHGRAAASPGMAPGLLLCRSAHTKREIGESLGEAPIDRSSQSVSEDRPEIDSFRTKNVD
jgi:hypothetical protein